MGGSSIPCAKTKNQLKQFEAKEDCFIIDFDPDGQLDLSKLSLSDTSEADVCLVAEKGKIACRDYPHPRHDCAKFPFKKTPHETHCKLCYCYVCDIAAPCKKWVGKSQHCTAFDNDRWNIKRKLRRELREALGRRKIGGNPHPRHKCAKFPFNNTPDESHCEMCYCYVCELAAPCKKWVGKSQHCTAFDDNLWNIKRKLKRESVNRKKEAYKDIAHPRHRCVKYPFDQTPHESHCELCYCYVCEYAAPCEEWVGATGHCHAFNNQTWKNKREVWESENSEEEQSESDSEVSVTTAEQVQSNTVLPKDHQQEVQRSQTEVGGSGTVERGESTDEEPKIYVGNLPSTMRRNDWNSLFNKVGLFSVGKVREVSTGTGGFGFITMNSVEAAEKAIELLDGSILHGKVLTAKKAIPKHYSIYVGNLSPKVSAQCLEALFTRHGYKTVSAKIVWDRLTGQPRGFGFVDVSSENAREDAIRTLNGQVLDGRVIKLNHSY